MTEISNETQGQNSKDCIYLRINTRMNILKSQEKLYVNIGVCTWMIFMHHSTFLKETTILEREKEEIVVDFLLSTLLYCFKKKKKQKTMKHVQFQINSSSHEPKEQSNGS